jgi:GR25 family glycosyltransferase involved in LPS biosynthesis
MVDHIYCINLERRPDRRANASKQFSGAGIENVEFFKGTDGRIEAPEDIFISKPEYGCSDSHIRIWRDVVENGYETALVFEDDVYILPEFKKRLFNILKDIEIDPEWDYVNLGPLDWRDRNERITPNLTRGSAWGAHCYLISQRGAKKLSVWDTEDLRYCQDVQVARSPIKMYYAENPLANQESYSSKYGILTSWLKGDIGFDRTPDWDFLIRDSAQTIGIFILIVVFIAAIIYIALKTR